jgi:hypothetical protein
LISSDQPQQIYPLRPMIRPTRNRPVETSLALSDLDRALIEAAEEMSFDWPEFLPVERITEMALASLLFAGLVVLGRFLFLSFAS